MKLAIRVAVIMSSAGLCAYLLLANFGAFTVTSKLTMKNESIVLGPTSRVEKTADGVKIKGDLAYFNTNMPFDYDSASIEVEYLNSSKDQNIQLGYRDSKQWHYQKATFDSPVINDLNWSAVGNNPTLYQRSPVYQSVTQLLADQNSKATGVYEYDDIKQSPVVINNYQHVKATNTLHNSLRGKFVAYVYLKNEPLRLDIKKSELNWLEGSDDIKLEIFSNDNIVFSKTFSDDGNSTANRIKGVETQINTDVNNLAEGVYKIVFDAPNDVIANSISTNLSKIVFASPLFVANSNVYGTDVITQANTFYTNASRLSFNTYHSQGLQTIKTGDKNVQLTAPNTAVNAELSGSKSNIVVPKSDVIMSANGYFSTSESAYFDPYTNNTFLISNYEDTKLTDFIVTKYSKPQKTDINSFKTKLEFDLTDKVLTNKRLNWILSSPGLSEKNNTYEIKNINVTLIKKGWLK